MATNQSASICSSDQSSISDSDPKIMAGHKRSTSISQRIHDAVVGVVNPQQPIAESPTAASDIDSIPDVSLDAADYEIGQCIGYGSSAQVYAATYKPTCMKVAIKSIDLDMFERQQIDELRKELSIMTLNKHKNLLPVYGSFVHGHFLQIVTPYVAAGSILDVLRNGHQDGLEEPVIATILKQVLEGLNYLHKSNHIHRDIKAGNILLATDGHVYLADFGVSASLGDHGDRKLRRTFVGSVCWLSPEVVQSQHGKGYDSKADIWSFGIAALEMANGRAPYAQYPPLKVLMLIMNNDPPRLDRDGTKNKYTRQFQQMIESCLVKDPVKRPTAEKLLEHPFFRQARPKSTLVKALIEDLPPLDNRQSKKPASQEKVERRVQSWTFDSVNSDDLTKMLEQESTTMFNLANKEEQVQSLKSKTEEVKQKPAKTHTRRPSRFQVVESSMMADKPKVRFASTSEEESDVSYSGDMRVVQFQDTLQDIQEMILTDNNVPAHLKDQVKRAFGKLQNSVDSLLAESVALKEQVEVLKK